MKTLASIAVLLFVSSLPVAAVAGEFDAILYKNPACGCCISAMQKESAREWRKRNESSRISAAA